MVGALADWFAVTALFKHPMGLKIPHTAIIPRKKDQIGESLGQFVQENFLSREVVDTKLRAIRCLAQRRRLVGQGGIGHPGCPGGLHGGAGGAGGPGRPRRPGPAGVPGQETHAGTRMVIDPGPDHGSAWLPTGTTSPRWTCWPSAPSSGWTANREMVVSLVAERSPSWVPAMVDTLLGEKLHRELQKYVRAVRSDPHHPMRLSIDAWLEKFAADMQDDAEMIAKVEAMKHSLLGDAQLRELAATSWSSIKAAPHRCHGKPRLGAAQVHDRGDPRPRRPAARRRAARGEGQRVGGATPWATSWKTTADKSRR